MSTQLFQTKCLSALDPQEEKQAFAQAARLIQAGEVVGFPTETVYGLGADATNPQAVAKIFAAKGRPQDNPLIVHICDIQMLEQVASSVPAEAYALFHAFWPGPLTVILPRGEAIPQEVSAGLDTVAVRFPAHEVAKKMICYAGVPVAAPSANRSGSPSPTTAAHVLADLNGRVPLVLDGGPAACGVESTVVTLCTNTPRLLRPGFVTVEELEAVLGKVEVDDGVLHQIGQNQVVASPGMKYQHYAPKAALTLLCGNHTPQQMQEIALQQGFDGLLVFEEDSPQCTMPHLTFGAKSAPQAQAASLFDALRALDDKGFQKVLCRMPAPQGVGLAVVNRLLRAAAFRVIQ